MMNKRSTGTRASHTHRPVMLSHVLPFEQSVGVEHIPPLDPITVVTLLTTYGASTPSINSCSRTVYGGTLFSDDVKDTNRVFDGTI